MKNQTVAILLSIFFGGVGLHKFYLGQIGKGLLYLFFFWTFIPAILSFFDFIKLVRMSGDKFQDIYAVK